MFLVIITAFANVLYILNKQSLTNEEDALYPRDLETGILNAWLSEYKLGLGSFDTDNFEGSNEGFIWMLWLVGTFLI